jgi:hypothetical protein
MGIRLRKKSLNFQRWGFDTRSRGWLTRRESNSKPHARMSESDKQPPSPSKQTSSVPLKKETVRVTLKAADAPQVPASSVPLAPPVRPPVPGGAPRPPTPTVALKPPAAPAQPTVKLATTTAPLKPAATSTALPGAKPAGGAPTLPKATVQLQAPTAPLGAISPSQAATFQMDDEDDDSEPHEGLIKILSGVGFAAALALLVCQIMLANVWINSEDNPRKGDWSQIIE